MKTNASSRSVLRFWVPIVCYVLAIVLQFVAFALVRRLEFNGNLIVAWCTFGAFCVMLLVLCVANRIKLREISLKMNLAEDISSNLFANMTKERTISAFKMFSNKVNRAKFNIILCKILAQVVALLIVVSFARATLVVDATWIYYAVACVLALVSPLFWLDLVVPFVGSIDQFALTKDEYPELYKLAGEVACDLGSELPVKIFPDYGNGISAEVVHGQLEVFLSCEFVSLLTREELKNILLCEVTIAFQTDTRKNNSYNRFYYSITSLNNLFSKLFFNGMFEEFNYWRRFQFIYEQRCAEWIGNEAVQKFGSAQIYVNACAKLASYNFFHESDLDEFEIKLHSRETFPSNYFVMYLEEYHRFCNENSGKINLYLQKYLQTDKDTRSTLADKMAYFKIDNFDYRQVQEQDDYLFEAQSFLMLGCNMMLTNAADRFVYGRRGFLHDQERYERYLLLKESGEVFNNAQKTGYLQLLYSMNRPECIRLCDEILAKYPQNAYACFYKGLHLAQELDEGCVSLLYSACSNARLRNDALNEIGQYACNVGNEKLFFEFRKSSAICNVRKNDDYSSSHAKIALHKPSLSSEKVYELVKQILDLAVASAERVFFASDAMHEDKLCVLLEFRHYVVKEEVWDVTHSVKAYLDGFTEENSQGTELRVTVCGYNVPPDKLTAELLRCHDAECFENPQF